MMGVNIGRTDQIIRVAVALAIFGLGLYFQSWWGLIGLVPLATGISRRCPPYAMLGIATCDARPCGNGQTPG